MQERIVKVVPRLSEEKLIEELLATNDEMNTAFTRYHRSATLKATAPYLCFIAHSVWRWSKCSADVYRFERRITNGPTAAQQVPSPHSVFILYAQAASWTLYVFIFPLHVSQNHTYVNLSDLGLTAEALSQSRGAAVSSDCSLSQSRADSLSSQMARLSE